MIDDGTLKVEEVLRRIDSLQEKAKFKAFGRTKPRTEKSKLKQGPKVSQGMEDEEAGSSSKEEEEHARELIQRQSEMLESEINNIKMMKHGRMTKVFKMREVIAGSKKQGQEAHAVKNKEGELVVANEEIMKVSLAHCLNTFKKKEPHEDAKMLIDIKEEVHEVRMKAECKDYLEIDKEDFNFVLGRFKKKKTKKL